MHFSLSAGEAASPRTVPSPAGWRRSAVVAACAGLLLVLAGWALVAAGLNKPWMLAAHASVPGPFAVIAWSSLTVLGLGLSALVLLLAADRKSGALAALLPLTFAIGGLATHVPKDLIAEPRPAATAIVDQLHVIGHAFTGAVSMPSGHSVTAAAAATLLCAMAFRGWWLRAFVALVAILVACSRVFVGAHWPGDVTVGLGLGLLVAALALACAGSRWHLWLAARAASHGGQRAIALLELVLAGAVLSQDTGYPAGEGMLWAIAAVALASSARRWSATRHRPDAPPAGDARARPL